MKAMKFFPITVLVLAASGLATTLFSPVAFFWLGMTLLATGQGLSVVVKQMGPLRQANLSEPADEREEAWRDRANLNAFGFVAVIAMIGTGTFGMSFMFVVLHGRTVPPLEISLGLIASTMFLLTLFLTMPTLFASWSMPDLIEDEPEGRLSFLKPRRHR
jgi:hypothetical protein